MLPDVYGVLHMGPESRVRERGAYINEQYSVALGEAIAQDPIVALGYKLDGDRGAFKGAAVDQIMMSFGDIPGEILVYSLKHQK